MTGPTPEPAAYALWAVFRRDPAWRAESEQNAPSESPEEAVGDAVEIRGFYDVSGLRADAEWRPSQQAVAALLAEIDALAAKGDYDEAVHLLLMRSVADINAFRPDLAPRHFSARDILRHPLLPEAARPAFADIVRWVERSFFAGIRVGEAGFNACRAAYVRFAAAEGLAPRGGV